jgi:hypothetical protein
LKTVARLKSNPKAAARAEAKYGKKSKSKGGSSDSDTDAGSDSNIYRDSEEESESEKDKCSDSDSGDDYTADRVEDLGPPVLPNKTNRAHQPLKSNTVLEEDPGLSIPAIPDKESVSVIDVALPLPLSVETDLGSSIPETAVESGPLIPETVIGTEVESEIDLGSSIPKTPSAIADLGTSIPEVGAEKDHGSLVPEREITADCAPSIPPSRVTDRLTSELELNFPDPIPLIPDLAPLIPLPLTTDPPDSPLIPDPVPSIPARKPMVIVRKAFIPLRPKKGPGARGGTVPGPTPDPGP